MSDTSHCPALQLMTFGVDNNDPAWVLQQHLQLGVAAAIVDDVPKVAAGLVAGLELDGGVEDEALDLAVAAH